MKDTERRDAPQQPRKTYAVTVVALLLCFVVTCDRPTPVRTWSRTYDAVNAWSAAETQDSGYIVAGRDSGGAWLAELTASGDTIWTHSYGGGAFAEARAVCQTADGGYVFVGRCYPNQASTSSAWLVKVDAHGGVVSEYTYGGSYGGDCAWDVLEAADGSYVVAGEMNRDSSALVGEFWLAGIAQDGTTRWEVLPGGSGAAAVCRAADGGYVAAGGQTLLRTNAAGGVEWAQQLADTFGGLAYAVAQDEAGGYMLAGGGRGCGWQARANSSGLLVWERDYGDVTWFWSMDRTADGDYVLAGHDLGDSSSLTDIQLVKATRDGSVIWSRSYGGTGFEYASSIRQTSDGGYIVSGQTSERETREPSAWILKLDSNGDCAGSGK